MATIRNFNKHLQYWRDTTTDHQYELIEKYINDVHLGTLSDAQLDEIIRFLGDSPQTLYFLGRVSGCLKYINQWEEILQRDARIIKRGIKYKDMCDQLVTILESPMWQFSIELTDDQEILADMLPHFHDPDIEYIDLENLIKSLKIISDNLGMKRGSPSYPLAESRRGNRPDVKYQLFCRELINIFWSLFQRYPVLSETSNDFEALCVVLEAYGCNRSDKLKPLKEAVLKSKYDDKLKARPKSQGKK